MNQDFKIHCIVVCKNEADVIGFCLTEAAKWADFIYVYDGASTDGTWEVVCGLNNPKIIPWKQDRKVFKEGLRAEVFNEFQQRSASGDWWFQLNADEFYPDDPKEFLASIPNGENFVWGTMVEYVITEEDVKTINFSRPFTEIMPQLRHYYVSWSEPRAFRYRPGLTWNENCAWPYHVGVVARKRIIYKHYPCRSQQQIQNRMKIREENRNRGFEGWKIDAESWRASIKKSANFLYDDGFTPLEIDESKLPRHLEKPPVRLLKRVIHRLGIWQ